MSADLSVLDGALAGAVKRQAAALRDHADAVEAWSRTRRTIMALVASGDDAGIREAVIDHYEDEMARRICVEACDKAARQVFDIHTEIIAACVALRKGAPNDPTR